MEDQALQNHPLMHKGSDPNRVLALDNQKGKVAYLGATWGDPSDSTIRRKARISSDKYCFITVLNCVTNSIEHPEVTEVEDQEAYTRTEYIQLLG